MIERSTMLTRFVMSLALANGFLIASDADAQTNEANKRVKTLSQGQASPPATSEQIGWISGSWHGEGLGGKTEEVWSKPSKGSMMGMFKLLQEDKVVFYEMMTITPRGSSLVLRIKHFDEELRGWEEKEKSVEFPFVEVSESKAYFSGLTFEKKSANAMTVVVAIKDKKTEKVEDVAFEFHRQESEDEPVDGQPTATKDDNRLNSPMQNARNMSFVATKDVVAAKKFYGEKLGLEMLHEDNLAVMYRVGQNMVLRVQRMKEFTVQPFTVSGWQVDDLKSTVAKLAKQGVTFEKYGFLKQDELGLHVFENGDEVVWLKDPDGNILSIAKLQQ